MNLSKCAFTLFIALVSVNAYADNQTELLGYYLNKVVGNDMSPAIEVGDRIATDVEHYKNNEIARGDIVLFPSPKNIKQYFSKRVIGLSGETITFKGTQVFIDGKLLIENYVSDENSTKKINITYSIPEDNLFLMGDNRDNSYDSRHFGFIHKSKIKGKIKTIYLSQNPFRIKKFKDPIYP